AGVANKNVPAGGVRLRFTTPVACAGGAFVVRIRYALDAASGPGALALVAGVAVNHAITGLKGEYTASSSSGGGTASSSMSYSGIPFRATSSTGVFSGAGASSTGTIVSWAYTPDAVIHVEGGATNILELLFASSGQALPFAAFFIDQMEIEPVVLATGDILLLHPNTERNVQDNAIMRGSLQALVSGGSSDATQRCPIG
ncbi:unnamed protein product, partial [Amoebophrya sp. A25]